METLLIFGMGIDRRMAVPLNTVARLEEFDCSSVEWSGGRQVVQYRDGILPLIRLADVLSAEDTSDKTALLQVIVYARNDQNVGFVVDRIVDIVETTATVQRENRTSQLLAGTAVIQGKVTDILDLEIIIKLVEHDLVQSNQMRRLPKAA